MKKLLLLLLCATYAYTSTHATLKPHEQWWTKNVDAKMKDFASWLGDEEADSRVKMRKYIKTHGYKDVLDVPCGLCTEYVGYKKHGIDITYYGVDITPQLVARAQSAGINVTEGSIEDLPFGDSAVDVCYARHILEHLRYYEKAIDELIRVASEEVIVVFFIKPDAQQDHINPSICDGALLYHNRYNKELLELYALRNAKVSHTMWQELNDKENVLHIYLFE